MQNPFPGMNPYLEQSELWHQVRSWLTIAIADKITSQIAPEYRVSLKERIYTTTELTDLIEIYEKRRMQESQTATATLIEPVKIMLPIPEKVIERYLEVRSTQTKELITIIEILSPKNKRSKEGRAAYESKRQKILGSLTHLVEIDLLRQGESMPILGATNQHYQILVSRSYARPSADLYAFNLKEPIPTIPVPLRHGETEPLLDLQKILNDVYDRARFDLAIDYSTPIKFLEAEDAAWAKEITSLGE